MLSSTGLILRTAAAIYTAHGHHDGPHFASTDGRLDPAAAIYRAATGRTPWSFANDDDLALLLIGLNEPVMDAIRALSAHLPTQAPDTNGEPDVVEHTANLDSYTHPRQAPATPNVVVGNLLRAADAADALAGFPQQRTAA